MNDQVKINQGWKHGLTAFFSMQILDFKMVCEDTNIDDTKDRQNHWCFLFSSSIARCGFMRTQIDLRIKK